MMDDNAWDLVLFHFAIRIPAFAFIGWVLGLLAAAVGLVSFDDVYSFALGGGVLGLIDPVITSLFK